MLTAILSVVGSLKTLWSVAQSALKFVRGRSVVEVSLIGGALITVGLLLLDHMLNTDSLPQPKTSRISGIRPGIRILNEQKAVERKLDQILSLLASQRTLQNDQLRDLFNDATSRIRDLHLQQLDGEEANDTRFAAVKKEVQERYVGLEAKLDLISSQMRQLQAAGTKSVESRFSPSRLQRPTPLTAGTDSHNNEDKNVSSPLGIAPPAALAVLTMERAVAVARESRPSRRSSAAHPEVSDTKKSDSMTDSLAPPTGLTVVVR